MYGGVNAACRIQLLGFFATPSHAYLHQGANHDLQDERADSVSGKLGTIDDLAQRRFHIANGRLLEGGQKDVFLCREALPHVKRTKRMSGGPEEGPS